MGVMEIILLADVDHLGAAGDVVKVRRGYGRNFLIPEGKAEQVTASRLKRIENLKKRAEALRAAALAAAQETASKIDGKSVSITKKAGEEGKLYGSVTTADIATAIREQLGIAVDKRDLTLTEGAIKLAGEHPATAKLYSGVNANFVVNVTPE